MSWFEALWDVLPGMLGLALFVVLVVVGTVIHEEYRA